MANNMTFKTIPLMGVVFIACCFGASPATGQILVHDRDVEDVAEDIVDEIEAADENRTDFEDNETIVYYDDTIERLDKLIDALSHVTDETRDAEIFATLTDQETTRENIFKVSEGDGVTFGLTSLGDTGEDNVENYLQRYGYLRPNQMFPGNVASQNQLIDEHKALYFADALVSAVDESRMARHDAYKAFIVKAAGTDDAHEALDINNALLIENGRNLNLLIQLQAAQLSADTALLRSQTRSRETVSNIFGLRGDTN